MARIKQKYKTLDCRIKPKEERKAEHISGYEWAIRKVSDEYDILINHIVILITVYDYEFFSGHTLEKRMPVSGKHIFKILKELQKNGWISKAFDESEVNVSRRMGEGTSVHVHVEPRMIRERFKFTRKANEVCERFLEICQEHGNMLVSYDNVRETTDISRNAKGTLVSRKHLNNDGVAYPYADNDMVYYEEDDNVDKWYAKQKK